MYTDMDDLHPGFGTTRTVGHPSASTLSTCSFDRGQFFQRHPADRVTEGDHVERTSTSTFASSFITSTSSEVADDSAWSSFIHSAMDVSADIRPSRNTHSFNAFYMLATISQASRTTTSAKPDAHSQHARTLSKTGLTTELTFFQRHFTKPAVDESEKRDTANNRRFSFFSRGSLIVGTIMLLSLLALAAAAVAVTFSHRHPRGEIGATSAKTLPVMRLAIDENFPDPAIWYANDTWYAFATNNRAGILGAPKNASASADGVSNIQLATSKDFFTWDLLNSSHDPLPKTGAWATPGRTNTKPSVPKANVWAPGIVRRPMDGKFVMYYAAERVNATQMPGVNVTLLERHPNPHCIGAAVSESDDPAGRYDPAPNTIACPVDEGGAIDAYPHIDQNGTLWVAYKVDGNNIGHGGDCGNTFKPLRPTPIMLQKMKDDGLTTDGEPIQILDRTAADGPLVEAPALVQSHEGIYFLLFSSGCTSLPTYDIKYATATNIEGPYTRARFPLLKSGDWNLLAPGSASVHMDDRGGFNMVFHARVPTPEGQVRAMYTTKLEFDGTTMTMFRDDGTTEQQ